MPPIRYSAENKHEPCTFIHILKFPSINHLSSFLIQTAMNFLRRSRTPSILEWVFSNSADRLRNPLWPIGSSSFYFNGKIPTFYRQYRAVQTVREKSLVGPDQRRGKISRATRRKAQAALLDYLHVTRSLRFTDAEHMSNNSPHFVEKLLQNVDIESDIGHSIARFLRYHPINEFEPFFESLGLTPQELSPLLPRDLLFLSDDYLLLANYYTLCNYGIERNKIGKIYKEATELFRFDTGVLEMKLQAYEEMGLSQSFLAKLVVCSPYLLLGEVNPELIKVFEILRKGSIELGWVEEHLSEKSSYDWSRLLALLNLFGKTGFSEEQICGLVSQHPDILFDDSGDTTLLLIVLLIKFGSTMPQICYMFLEFPQMQIVQFVLNIRRCLLLFNEIGMEVHEIGKIVRSNTLLLGSFTVKKANSLILHLNVGKRQLCQFIQENPQEMRTWIVGRRIRESEKLGAKRRARMLRAKFLEDLGYGEDSTKMQEAMKVFRGRAAELSERFDCLVEAGLDRKDVCEMIKVSPHILNQSKNLLQMKIDFLVNQLGYPVSTLVAYPNYLAYNRRRVKFRLAMYQWLKEQGTVDRTLALSTVLACSDNYFLSQYVKHHPRGLEVWNDLKKTYSQ